MTVCSWRSPTLKCERVIGPAEHAYCYPHFRVLPRYYRTQLLKVRDLKSLTKARALAADWVTKYGSYWDAGGA